MPDPDYPPQPGYPTGPHFDGAIKTKNKLAQDQLGSTPGPLTADNVIALVDKEIG